MKRLTFCFFIALFLVACGDKNATRLLPSDTVMAFGDSLTFGYGAPPSASYPAVLEELIGVKVVNEGVSGNTTADGIKRIDAALVKHQPKLVLLSLGGNDMLRGVPEPNAKANLQTLVMKIKEAGAAPVLISQPKPSLVGVKLTGLSDAEMYQALGRELGVLVIEDVFSELLSEDEFKSDLIHLNAKGYALVAKGVAEGLKDAGHLK